MKNLNHEQLIGQWHRDRNLIDGSTDKDQYMKLIQEAGELSDSLCKGKDIRDDIGDMMVEIQNVVSNHLSNVKKDLQDTMNVINKLPLVISLRNQIRKLENENKQLKMLVDSIGEEKNIELEIMEVPKDHTSLEQEGEGGIGIPTDGSDENSDNALCADSADEDELGIAPENGEYMVTEEQVKPEKLTTSNKEDELRDI